MQQVQLAKWVLFGSGLEKGINLIGMLWDTLVGPRALFANIIWNVNAVGLLTYHPYQVVLKTDMKVKVVS